MKAMKILHRWIIGPSLALFFFSANQLLATEADSLFQQLQATDYQSRLDGLKLIERNSVSSEQINALLEKRLLNTLKQSSSNSKKVDEISWTCKAFASSGDPAAKSLLLQVAHSGGATQTKHCKTAAGRLSHYAKRRKILSASPVISGLSPELSRAVNLLRLGDFDMQREAAKRIIRAQTTDSRVFNLVRDTLLKGAANLNTRDRVAVDACAWMCKCLVASGSKDYLTALQQVEETTPARKVKQYAQKAVKQLSGK